MDNELFEDNHSNNELLNKENILYSYDLINGWIANADNKVSVSCAIFTGAFGVISFISENIDNGSDLCVTNECWRTIYLCSFVISIVVLLLAILFYSFAIFPNLKTNGVDNNKYPIYFGDIQSLKYEEYYDRVATGNKAFLNEIVHECWFNSHICMKKMKRYRYALFFSLIAIIAAIISLISHYCMYL